MIYTNGITRLTPLSLLQVDKKAYLQWLNDPEVNAFTSRGVWPVTVEEAKDYLEGLREDRTKIVWAVEEGAPDHAPVSWLHIGNVCLQQIDLLNRSAEIAILIGHKPAWGKGHATRAMQMAIAHGFVRLGLNRIWAGTAAQNLGFIKAAGNCRMRREGKSLEALFLNGTFMASIQYAILYRDWIEQGCYTNQEDN